MTVFFSLLSILFLGLTFSIVEAVRYRCARSHCADLTAVGNWSVFSEYENQLLEKFDIFGIDASEGGSFSAAGLNTRLKSYLDENADVTGKFSGKLPGLTLDPFTITAESAKVSEYALLSDNNGEYFYQQAVEFMHKTAWMNALGKLSDSARQAEDIKTTQEKYKEAKKDADTRMEDMQRQAAQRQSQVESVARSQAEQGIQDPGTARMLEEKRKAEKVKNPLWRMIRLSFRSLLPLVCGKKSWSVKKISGGTLLSKRPKQKGTLKLETPRGGATDNLLFREYLMDHFPDWNSKAAEGKLDYQLEYILCGMASDQKNLKKTVKKLLLIREAYNYLFLQSDPESLNKTETLAALILGWTGNEALVETLRQAFVVYWAYGESLYDVRILMHQGKVPIAKTAADWNISLSDLYDLEDLLNKADHTTGHGEDYTDYLRLLLNLQPVSTQKKRALDLLESDLKQVPGMESFQADNCVIAMKDTCRWSIRPVFSFVPKIFLGSGLKTGNIQLEGGFAY